MRARVMHTEGLLRMVRVGIELVLSWDLFWVGRGDLGFIGFYLWRGWGKYQWDAV